MKGLHFPLWLLLLLLVSIARTATAQGNALALNGTNSYAYAPDNASLRLGVGTNQSFTIELSFYLAPTNPVGYRVLVLKDRSYELGLEFHTNSATTQIHFGLWSTTNSSLFSRFSTFIGALKPGRHHIAAVFKNTPTQDLRMVFLDGLVAGRDDFTSFPSGVAASTTPLWIGGAGGTNSFPGWIDEVRFSDSIRYTNESAPGLNVPYRIPLSPFAPDASTVALWHFDESPGATTFLDASAHGNHLTAFNGASTGPPPVVQNAGSLDLSFYPGLGIADDQLPAAVHSLGLQTNGQILIGGDFLHVDGLARSNLARLNLDGTVDPSFNVTLSGDFGATDVPALLVLPNNQILIGGNFTNVNGVRRVGLARLNPDGSTDATFGPVFTGNYNPVNTIARQPDGKIIVSGSFFSIAGANRQYIARLNADGTIDASFNAGGIFSGGVGRVLLQPDGKLLCKVSFYNFTSSVYTNLIRLNTNGSWDTTFQPTLVNLIIRDAIALQPDGKIMLTGWFTNVNGAKRVGAARLETNGLLDVAFNFTNNLGTIHTNGGQVEFAAVQADGKLVLGGAFFASPSAVVPSLARFLPNGALDSTFQPAGFYRLNNTVLDLKLLPDGKLLIAGKFPDVNGYSRSGIARLQGDPILPPRFLSITRQPSGTMQLVLTNSTARPVILQIATNLSSPQWRAIATNVSPGQITFQDTNTPPGRAFYRALHP